MIGLLALLFLLFREWRGASLLTAPGHALLARGVVLLFALGGIFNSLIIDHAEGLFFAWLSGLLFSSLSRSQPG